MATKRVQKRMSREKRRAAQVAGMKKLSKGWNLGERQPSTPPPPSKKIRAAARKIRIVLAMLDDHDTYYTPMATRDENGRWKTLPEIINDWAVLKRKDGELRVALHEGDKQLKDAATEATRQSVPAPMNSRPRRKPTCAVCYVEHGIGYRGCTHGAIPAYALRNPK